MNKKFKLTKTKKEQWGITFYQIEALKDFGNVSKGDKGGWIEKEGNLSQEDNAWVSGNAQVSGNALVSGNAQVSNAWVSGNTWVYGNAWVSGDARVYGDAWVSGNAWVSGGNARVYGNAWVSGDARVSGNARVSKKIKLISGYFYHTKQKSEKIETVDTYNDDYETLACNPKIEPLEEEKVGKKVKIKLDGGQILEGTLIE